MNAYLVTLLENHRHHTWPNLALFLVRALFWTQNLIWTEPTKKQPRNTS
jgi:predicted thioredoxin/glutaredoxin